MGNVASEATRIGQWRYDNEREKASQASDAEDRQHKNTFSLKKGTKKTQPMRAALSDFKNYTLKRK